jgi:copper chaperone
MRFALVLVSLFATNVALAHDGDDDDCPMKNAPADTTAATTPVDVSKAPGEHVALAITGMHCAGCSVKVNTALTAIAGVNAVAVDFHTGKAEVAYDKDKTNADALIAAVNAIGGFVATVDATPPATTPQG